MKIKNGFWVREAGGARVAVPLTGDARALGCIVNLNESGALLFERLQAGAEREALIAALLDAYAATSQQAASAVDDFLAQLRKAQLLEA